MGAEDKGNEPETGIVDLKAVEVRPIKADEVAQWDLLMRNHHYLGFRRLVGKSLRYVAVLHGKWVALLGWGSAAFKASSRDRWIGWSPQQQWQRLHLVANNQRFLVLPEVRIQNLASRVLSLNLNRLADDWRAAFGHPVLLAETFVDPAQFRGTCYRAAGWFVLGSTRGFRRHAGRYYHHGHPKTVLVRPLHRDAKQLLCGLFLTPELRGGNMENLDLSIMNVDKKGGLLERLREVPDPRMARGIRHRLIPVLSIAICACLAGAKSILAIAQWAANQPKDTLRRLGCRRKESGFVAPSEPTIRRVLQRIDADKLDQVTGCWLAEQSDGKGVAVDGKTLRGSNSGNGPAVHLVSAVLHKERITIAQREVDKKSNEITATKPLLEHLDLKGKVVTADAMHTQANFARYLVEEKKADYLLPVKGNQPLLLQAVEDLDDSDFFSLIQNPK